MSKDPIYWHRSDHRPLTERDWLSCRDRHIPTVMLEWLASQGVPRSKAGRRKLRLVAVALCRWPHVWELLTAGRRKNVDELERQAEDGGRPELTLAPFRSRGYTASSAQYAVETAARPNVVDAIERTLVQDVNAWARNDITPGAIDWQRFYETEEFQRGLFREVFGNPFRKLPPMERAWRLWRDGTIVHLAQKIYDTREFEGLPVLADALEEAGCTNTQVLKHCRSPRPHVRGCWVVDWVLGKSV